MKVLILFFLALPRLVLASLSLETDVTNFLIFEAKLPLESVERIGAQPYPPRIEAVRYLLPRMQKLMEQLTPVFRDHLIDSDQMKKIEGELWEDALSMSNWRLTKEGVAAFDLTPPLVAYSGPTASSEVEALMKQITEGAETLPKEVLAKKMRRALLVLALSDPFTADVQSSAGKVALFIWRSWNGMKIEDGHNPKWVLTGYLLGLPVVAAYVAYEKFVNSVFFRSRFRKRLQEVQKERARLETMMFGEIPTLGQCGIALL